MKRIISMVLIIALLICFAGCGQNPSPESPGNADEEAPISQSDEKIADGVYKLNIPINLTSCSGMFVNGSSLLVSGALDENNSGLFVFDISSGSKTLLPQFGAGIVSGFDDGSAGYLSDTGDLFRIQAPYTSMKQLTDSIWTGYCGFLSDGSFYRASESELNYYDKNGSFQFQIDLSDKYDYVSVRYIFENTIYATAGKFDGEPTLIQIDAKSGNYSDDGVTNISGIGFITDSYMVIKSEGNAEIAIYEKDGCVQSEHPFISTLSRFETIIGASDSFIATKYTGSDKAYVVIYDYEGNVYYFDSPQTNGKCTAVTGCFSNNRLYLCVMDNAAGSSELLYVATNELKPITRPEIQDESTPEPETPEYPQGVNILTGENAVIDFYDFTAEPLDDFSTSAALEIIDSVMEKFPVGFFDELLADGRSLTICITGVLTPLNSNSVSSPGGYTYSLGGQYFVALDATEPRLGELESTFSHELMHVIDCYLTENVDGTAYPDWNQYIPSDDVYYNSYRDSEGNEINDFEYTAYGYTNEADVWFPTPYCRISAIEDRAVLFSLMFTQNPYYTNFAHIKARMEYLSQILSDNFNSVRNSEDVIWEIN